MSEKKLAYSYLELMAIVLARDLRDGELGMTGAFSDVPIAACLLAQRLHAPNLTLVTPGQLFNPKPSALPLSGSDGRFMEGCEFVGSAYELFENSERGIDFMFYSGIQIDKHGNINLTYIGGDLKHPKFRGPGLANISFAVTAKRYYLYPTTHNKRIFVEKVDYLTAPGHIDGPEGRRKAGIVTEGPVLCVTPLAVMDFDEATRRMRLKSVHEGITVEQIVENTGFELIIPPQVPTTPAPNEEELSTLREIDRTEVLRR